DKELAEKLKSEVSDIKQFLSSGEDEERNITTILRDQLSAIPNMPLDDVPVGKDEGDNQLYREFGDIPSFGFEPKEHYELGEALGQMDFEGAAALSGSRFVVLKRDLARLERALGQFMLNMHTRENGYDEVSPPLLVRDQAVFGTGQLPKFADDLFKTTDGRWLIPTAEVPLTNLAADQIVEVTQLPMRFTALTPCFRSEAGSAGRDTRGMLRQHQFSKCELVSITKPEDSLVELERMIDCAEKVLKELELPFRTMTLCTGDMGFSARKTYDIEVWLPGQNSYREISSCSVCGDFQARRMNARYRTGEGKAIDFVHTLNGSGIATGRALIAVMENYQNEDGSISVPQALHPYMDGVTKIEKA
ncbi:MAG: serine--tRNA ligase, partial [Pseudomonadota bacterium]